MNNLPQSNVEYENTFEKEALILHAETVIRIADIDIDAFFLYMFYCMTAKRQSLATGKYLNQISASKDYCLQGMKWGSPRYQKARKILLKYKFIEDVIKKEDGIIKAWYVRIHFLRNAYKDPNPSYIPPVSKVKGGTDESASEPPASWTTSGPENPNTDRHTTSNTDRDIPDNSNHVGSVSGRSDYRPKKSHSSLEPCTPEQLWAIASRKNVSLPDVIRTHQAVLDAIEDGNKYKTKNVYLTVGKWVTMGISRGNIAELTPEARMILDWQNPAREKEIKDALAEGKK